MRQSNVVGFIVGLIISLGLLGAYFVVASTSEGKKPSAPTSSETSEVTEVITTDEI